MTLPDPSRAIAPSTTRARVLVRYWPTAVALFAAIVVRSFSWLNCDVSWLLTLGEQVLAGARPYVDFSEPNPPASILMYIPAILIGRLFGVAPEVVVTILIFAAALASLWLTGRILSKAGLIQPNVRPAMFAMGCLLLLILPGDAFAQREHIALLSILPILAVYALRASAKVPDPLMAVLAGIGGGIAIVIKPHFALALILPLAFVVWRSRTGRQNIAAVILSPEQLATALVAIAYVALIFWRFPDYIHYSLPIVLTIYVPFKHSLVYMIESPPVLLSAMAIIVSLGLGMHEFRSSAALVFSLAVLGFLLAVIIQAKGWPYQGYPAIALSLSVLSILLIRRLSGFFSELGTKRPSSADAVFGVVLFAGIYSLASVWFLFQPNEAVLVSEVARLVPANPKVLSFSAGPEIAFPLTRKLHGTPIGRSPFQWISRSADGVLASEQLDPTARRKIGEYERADRNELVDTIRTRRPDVILIGGAIAHQWAFSYPEIVQALQPYRRAKTVDKVEIWLPRAASQPSRQ